MKIETSIMVLGFYNNIISNGCPNITYLLKKKKNVHQQLTRKIHSKKFITYDGHLFSIVFYSLIGLTPHALKSSKKSTVYNVDEELLEMLIRCVRTEKLRYLLSHS